MKHERLIETAPGQPAPAITPQTYLRALHPVSGRGRPVLMTILAPDRVHALATSAEELPFVAPTWAEATSYVSLNRFHGRRRLDRLAALNALFLDLDTYKCPRLSQLGEAVLDRVILDHLTTIGLPAPSFMLDTGRGRAAIWLIEELPAAAHPRWRACQRALVEACRVLEADPACTDAARVFRLPGSINAKSGREVAVRLGTGRRHAFDDLADGFYRATGRPTRDQLVRRKAARNSARAALPTDRQIRGGLSPRQRFTQIRADLLALLEAWGGTVPEGRRNNWLHLYATCLTHVDPATDLDGLIAAMAAQATPGLAPNEVRTVALSARRRAEIASSSNPSADGRLHYSGARIAELLDVDDDLAARLGLRQVFGSRRRRALRAERECARRRASGAMSRADWLAKHATSRRRPWEPLGISRATWYRRGLHLAHRDKTGPCPEQGAAGTAEGGPEPARDGSHGKNTPARPRAPAGRSGPEAPEGPRSQPAASPTPPREQGQPASVCRPIRHRGPLPREIAVRRGDQIGDQARILFGVRGLDPPPLRP